MDLEQKVFIEALSSYSRALDERQLPLSYQKKYTILYIELDGTNQRIRYTRLSQIWGVEIETAQNIICVLKKYRAISTEQKTSNNRHDNYGYLFIEPLIHRKDK